MPSLLCSFQEYSTANSLVSEVLPNVVISFDSHTHRGHVLRLLEHLISVVLGFTNALWCSGSMAPSSWWNIPSLVASSFWSLRLVLCSNFISLPHCSSFCASLLPMPHIPPVPGYQYVCVFVRISEEGSDFTFWFWFFSTSKDLYSTNYTYPFLLSKTERTVGFQTWKLTFRAEWGPFLSM